MSAVRRTTIENMAARDRKAHAAADAERRADGVAALEGAAAARLWLANEATGAGEVAMQATHARMAAMLYRAALDESRGYSGRTRGTFARRGAP